jgi:hypothetical protein
MVFDVSAPVPHMLEPDTEIVFVKLDPKAIFAVAEPCPPVNVAPVTDQLKLLAFCEYAVKDSELLGQTSVGEENTGLSGSDNTDCIVRDASAVLLALHDSVVVTIHLIISLLLTGFVGK